MLLTGRTQMLSACGAEAHLPGAGEKLKSEAEQAALPAFAHLLWCYDFCWS